MSQGDALYDLEYQLKDRLAALQRRYQEEAKPIIDHLVYLETLKPPAPMVFNLSELSLDIPYNIKRLLPVAE